ncbi:MAG: hypothetical protein COA79_14935 [Planctomycetota bacterium]|nr:MAG: hypothetical protein COA79_14935 [Planctomycetota bacterium]
MNEIEAALILSRKPTVGAARFKQLMLENSTPIEALNEFNKAQVKKSDKAPLDIQNAMAYIQEHHATEITWLNKLDYPNKLSLISEPPPVLFYDDPKNILSQTNHNLSIGIVGSRKTSMDGQHLTEEITKLLTQQDYILVSGLAEGIDSICHKTCLNNGGKTIGVIANGIDIVYPKSNDELFREMRENACICTEFFPKAPPKSSYFPTRNRIIAGLSDIVIMIEGNEKSGALYTVKNTLKTNRLCFVPDPSNFKLRQDGLVIASELGAQKFSSIDDLLEQISKISLLV